MHIRDRLVRCGAQAAVLSTALLVAIPSASAAERLALLIGNARYTHATPLKNPSNDITAMAKTLRQLGFEVTLRRDLKKRELEDALFNFGERAANKDTAVVFYSGHGMEIDGRNYLLPIDAALQRPGRAKIEAVDVEAGLRAVQRAKRLAVVILDACRNGPPGGTRSVGRGFARMETSWPGLVIAYSTAPGAVAWDGHGDLSPYTQALVEQISRTPEIDVRQLFTSLRESVTKYADARQQPFAVFGDMKQGRTSFTTTYQSAHERPPVARAQPRRTPRPSASRGERGERPAKEKKPTPERAPPSGCHRLDPSAGKIEVKKGTVLCSTANAAATMTVVEAATHYLSYAFMKDGKQETRCYPGEDCVAPWTQVFRYNPSSDGQSGLVTAGW